LQITEQITENTSIRSRYETRRVSSDIEEIVACDGGLWVFWPTKWPQNICTIMSKQKANTSSKFRNVFDSDTTVRFPRRTRGNGSRNANVLRCGTTQRPDFTRKRATSSLALLSRTRPRSSATTTLQNCSNGRSQGLCSVSIPCSRRCDSRWSYTRT
jgi:hypothetical protein